MSSGSAKTVPARVIPNPALPRQVEGSHAPPPRPTPHLPGRARESSVAALLRNDPVMIHIPAPPRHATTHSSAERIAIRPPVSYAPPWVPGDGYRGVNRFNMRRRETADARRWTRIKRIPRNGLWPHLLVRPDTGNCRQGIRGIVGHICVNLRSSAVPSESLRLRKRFGTDALPRPR